MTIGDGYDPEQSLDIIEREFEPSLVDVKEDSRTEPPDEIAARHELLGQLRQTAKLWPKSEREIFELYFVEGFEPEEISMIIRQPASRAKELIALLQTRLREKYWSRRLYNTDRWVNGNRFTA